MRTFLSTAWKTLRTQRLAVTVAFFLAAFTAALLNAYPTLIRIPRLGPAWVVVFSLLTGALGAATNVAVSAPSASRPNPRRVGQVLARSLPPVRSAPAFTQFTGRQRELEDWVASHDHLRELRTTGQIQAGPVVLAIHGPTGVGKSAFALELARRLAKMYPDGVFAVSFGTGATARSAADIARELLIQLGWPDTPEDMPHTTVDRVSTLRSLTRGKAMLFVFDAVRDHDQVRQVMPAETRCAVILVSRREIGSSLGFPARAPLARPTMHDCLEMFTAIRSAPWTREAQLAVEVIELCDRLPLAIKAAAEQARDSGDLRYVVQRLRSPESRLAALDYGGRKVGDKLESEFERLAGPMREAITLLAELDAESFVPWVLRPLLNLEQHASNTFVAALEAIQLIERVADDPTGQRRYTVSPLAWLYARAHKPDSMTKGAIQAARQRLDDAFLDLIDDVLYERGDGYQRVRPADTPPRFRTAGSTIASVIEPHLDEIVRREYLTLVRVIRVAPMPTHARLIWRVAALLDGRVPSLRRPEQLHEIDEAFARAIEAANRTGEAFAEVDVRLAYAQFLIAVERYGDGLDCLNAVDNLLVGDVPEAARRRLREIRVRSWAYLQAAAYKEAEKLLTQAFEIHERLPGEERGKPETLYDYDLIRIFSQEAQRTPFSARVQGRHDFDISRFRYKLQESEAARRRGHWSAAEQPLLDLLTRDGDARGRATALYRMARLKLDHALEAAARKNDSLKAMLSQAACEYAADCVYVFGTIANDLGQIRARTLLLRTLVLAGHYVAAAQLSLELTAELDRYERANPRNELAFLPLRARLYRARGELAKAQGQDDEAWNLLTAAAQAYHELGDWTNHAAVWRLLDGES